MPRQYLNITKPAANKARIEIDGTIGGWDWGTWKRKNTGTDIRKQLKEIEGLDVDEIEVLITSMGGYVDDALQIHDALKSHTAKVTTIVQGFCASSATIIACAGDRRVISPNAVYLIHKCMSSVWDANENDLEAELDDQRTINGAIMNIYRGVLKKEEADLVALFNANDGDGKWISAEEALAFGFATEIQEFNEDKKKTASGMARFLNRARVLFPYNDKNLDNHDNNGSEDSHFNNNQTPNQMKNILMSFAMLGALLCMKEDAEYDEKEGLQLKPDQLQTVEDALKAYDDLKTKASKTESDLKGAQDALATAEKTVADKDALIATLTAERDNYKAKYENAPANVPGVNGKDVNVNEESVEDYVKNSAVYQEFFEENL